MANARVAGVDETVHILVDTDRELTNPCTVTFFVRESETGKTAKFEEKIEARPAKVRKPDDDPDTKRFSLEWKVKLNAGGTEGGEIVGPAEVTFEVVDANNILVKPRADVPVEEGGAKSGGAKSAVTEPKKGTAADPPPPGPPPPGPATLVVAKIVITKKQECLDLMRHEFAKADGDHAFDPARPQKFIDALSPPQRSVLLNYQLAAGAPRLVAFVTLTPKDTNKLMGADFAFLTSPGGAPINKMVPMKANAYFTVFRCVGAGKDVELVLHTEHLFANDLNDRARALLAAAQPKEAPVPKRYKLATGALDPVHNFKTPFCRFFAPEDSPDVESRSKDLMTDSAGTINTMHGTINTHGCWSLFKNYNWPRAHYSEFDFAYRQWRQNDHDVPDTDPNTDHPSPDDAPPGEKPDEKKKREARLKSWKNRREAQKLLVKATEKDAAPYDMSLASWQKFLDFDQNWAYYKFFHDIIGLEYSRFDAFVHFSETHGFTQRGRMPAAGRPPAGVNNAFTDNEVVNGKPEGIPGWTKNVFGDEAHDYVRGKKVAQKGGGQAFVADNLKKASWADLYIFKEAKEPFSTPA